MGQVSGHKTSLNKLKIEIISSNFSAHNGMKLEANNRRNWKICRYTEMKPHTPKQPMGQRREKNYLETNKNRNTVYQNYGM